MITYKSTIPVKEYNAMREAVGWKVLEEEQAQTGLDNSAYLTSVWDGDKPVGMARVVSDGGYMMLVADVMVLPEYQGKGIGRQLMINIGEYYEALSSDGRCIMVNLMATTGNEGFYRKFGFVERPNDEMGAGMVRWINP